MLPVFVLLIEPGFRVMHVKPLKVFCDVVGRRSFSQAADENGISQSGLMTKNFFGATDMSCFVRSASTADMSIDL